jgi:hypothetical protein
MVIYLHHIFVRGSFDPFSTHSLPPHVPVVHTVEGYLDLLFLCILAELGELLDVKAYEKVQMYDKEVEAERLFVIYVRGLAREIKAWCCSYLIFHEPSSARFHKSEAVYDDLRSHQIKTLANYKKEAQLKNMVSEDTACSSAAFEAMAEKYFPGYNCRELPKGANVKDFDWDGAGYSLSRAAHQEEDEDEPCSCESPPESSTFVKLN